MGNVEWWLGMATGIAVGVLLCVAGYLFQHRRERSAKTAMAAKQQEIDGELLQRVRKVMAERQLFLNSELRLEDVAQSVGITRNRMSELINKLHGDTFKQLVNSYRVEYAQQLMLEQPNLKMLDVAHKSGFSSERSYFRSFKECTGLSPAEWKKQTRR